MLKKDDIKGYKWMSREEENIRGQLKIIGNEFLEVLAH